MDHDICAKMRLQVPAALWLNVTSKITIMIMILKHHPSPPNIKHQTSSSLHSSWPHHLSGWREWSYSYTRHSRHSRHSRHARHARHWRNTSCQGAARRANVTSGAPSGCWVLWELFQNTWWTKFEVKAKDSRPCTQKPGWRGYLLFWAIWVISTNLRQHTSLNLTKEKVKWYTRYVYINYI